MDGKALEGSPRGNRGAWPPFLPLKPALAQSAFGAVPDVAPCRNEELQTLVLWGSSERTSLGPSLGAPSPKPQGLMLVALFLYGSQ